MEGVKETITSPERKLIKQDALFIRDSLEYMSQARVLRYRESGEAPFLSAQEVKEMRESVAEHVGLMHMLATNILDKALVEGDTSFEGFDVMLMLRMIQLHDLEESITGDVRHKDEAHHAREEVAFRQIKDKAMKLNYGESIVYAIDAYREKQIREARFVKAVDELQAWFYIINTRRFDASTRDFSKPEDIKGYVCGSEFPTVKRVMDILLGIMQNPSLIKSDVPTMELIQQQYQA